MQGPEQRHRALATARQAVRLVLGNWGADRTFAGRVGEKSRREWEIDAKVLALLVDASLEVAGAVEAADLAAWKMARWETEKKSRKLVMQELVEGDLSFRGQLHACGLLEYAEKRLFPQLDLSVGQQDRKSMWGELGRRLPALEARILEAVPTWTPESIPDTVVQLHSRLAALVQSGDMWSFIGKVLLMEGTLSPEEMRFLKCLADAVHCPCRLCYLPPPGSVGALLRGL